MYIIQSPDNKTIPPLPLIRTQKFRIGKLPIPTTNDSISPEIVPTVATEKNLSAVLSLTKPTQTDPLTMLIRHPGFTSESRSVIGIQNQAHHQKGEAVI